MFNVRPWVVIAPHPDDETLGCGGTLLRARARGIDVHWVIVTEIPPGESVAGLSRSTRDREICQVAEAYGFASTRRLGFSTLTLDTVPLRDIIDSVASTLGDLKPGLVLTPWSGDVHTDHRVCFQAIQACVKPFRSPWVRQVQAYEVLSETNVNLDRGSSFFDPTYFVGIDEYLEKKLEIMRLYSGQLGDHPFPRSEVAITALAELRGAQGGTPRAEAFKPLFAVE